jgi:hypothetical protein
MPHSKWLLAALLTATALPLPASAEPFSIFGNGPTAWQSGHSHSSGRSWRRKQRCEMRAIQKHKYKRC